MNAAMERISASDRLMLEALQHDTFGYFIRNANSTNGLIADKTDRDSAASTAAVGLALSSYCVAVERGWLTRADAAKSTVTTLRFFDSCERGPTADATGYHGFFYHFLDMSTGRRALQSELSTIDTALLIAGVLTCGWYFSRANDVEAEIRELSDRLYRQVDWQWMCNDGATLGHGWKPECGFLVSAWNQGYSEALLLYILALGSPTYAIEPRGYREWTETFEVKIAYGKSYIYAGPLFIHQLPQVWLDFRGIRDHCDRKFDVDYFENSQRAVHVQRLYAAHNPHGFAHYSKNAWGITASDGPGPTERVIDGVRREFFGYRARGAPFGPDDGTISPWAAITSLPFAPRLVCESIRHATEAFELKDKHGPGFEASFNATFPERIGNRHGWISPSRFGLNEGPIVLMLENYFTGMIWNAFRNNPHVIRGLRAADFRGGWLDDVVATVNR